MSNMNEDLKLDTLRNVENMMQIALLAYSQGEFEVFASQIHMASQLLEHWYPKEVER